MFSKHPLLLHLNLPWSEDGRVNSFLKQCAVRSTVSMKELSSLCSCLQSSKKLQKLNVYPQNLHRSFQIWWFSFWWNFINRQNYIQAQKTSYLVCDTVWFEGEKNMSHIVPFCRSHSSKAQYWQCGCLGDNSSNGSLYMVRGCIISFIFSLRRWIFKVFGNTFVSGCNVHGEGVLIFKNVSVYHKCKQYFFQLFFYMYSEVSNMKNKMNNKENTM